MFDPVFLPQLPRCRRVLYACENSTGQSELFTGEQLQCALDFLEFRAFNPRERHCEDAATAFDSMEKYMKTRRGE